MNQAIMTAALAAALLAPDAAAGRPAKAGPAAETRARLAELRLGVRRDEQSLKSDWLAARRELAELKAREAEERRAASASGAEPAARRARLAAVAKKYALERAALRARRGPVRGALKVRLRDDRSRLRRLRTVP